jgi:hypothetical protein
MRKFLHAGIVVVSALLVALPMTAANAATGHVLTIRSVHGRAVKPGAVLAAGLAKGTVAVFSLGSEKLTCKSARFAATVTSNPARPGAAKERLTTLKFSKCTVNVAHVTVKSVKVLNLPYHAAVSDAKGHPVTVMGHARAKPVKTTVTVALGMLQVSCSYRARRVNGHESNLHSTISFVKQKFVKAGGPSVCAPSANFTAKFGPVRDLSVVGSPRVFVH